jgi:hypothetical protein
LKGDNSWDHFIREPLKAERVVIEISKFRVFFKESCSFHFENLLSRGRLDGLGLIVACGLFARLKKKKKLHGFSQQANYTDRATAACR